MPIHLPGTSVAQAAAKPASPPGVARAWPAAPPPAQLAAQAAHAAPSPAPAPAGAPPPAPPAHDTPNRGGLAGRGSTLTPGKAARGVACQGDLTCWGAVQAGGLVGGGALDAILSSTAEGRRCTFAAVAQVLHLQRVLCLEPARLPLEPLLPRFLHKPAGGGQVATKGWQAGRLAGRGGMHASRRQCPVSCRTLWTGDAG